MNESPNKRAVIVGIFVLIGLSLVVAVVFFIGGMQKTFESKMRIVSFFDDVNGLKKGNYIWFSGVKIGTINELRFSGLSQVEVILKIDKDIQQHIRKDSKVKISTDGFIGNKILIIYGGSEQSDWVQEGDTLQVEKALSTEDMMKTLQENNENLKAITSDFKIISKSLVAGEGTIGKLLNDNTLYEDISASTKSLQKASDKAQQMIVSLADFSSQLNKKGTLANDLVTDTIIFNSLKYSILQLQQIADTASAFLANVQEVSNNPNSSIGVLLHDEESGADLKETIKNLESSSKKLNEDLEALQHNFLLRRFFKKKAKEAEAKK